MNRTRSLRRHSAARKRSDIVVITLDSDSDDEGKEHKRKHKPDSSDVAVITLDSDSDGEVLNISVEQTVVARQSFTPAATAIALTPKSSSPELSKNEGSSVEIGFACKNASSSPICHPFLRKRTRKVQDKKQTQTDDFHNDELPTSGNSEAPITPTNTKEKTQKRYRPCTPRYAGQCFRSNVEDSKAVQNRPPKIVVSELETPICRPGRKSKRRRIKKASAGTDVAEALSFMDVPTSRPPAKSPTSANPELISAACDLYDSFYDPGYDIIVEAKNRCHPKLKEATSRHSAKTILSTAIGEVLTEKGIEDSKKLRAFLLKKVDDGLYAMVLDIPFLSKSPKSVAKRRSMSLVDVSPLFDSDVESAGKVKQRQEITIDTMDSHVEPKIHPIYRSAFSRPIKAALDCQKKKLRMNASNSNASDMKETTFEQDLLDIENQALSRIHIPGESSEYDSDEEVDLSWQN